MASDRLRIVLALRQRDVERARRDLADCLNAEARAAGLVRAIDDALLTGRSADRIGGDALAFQDMFANRRDLLTSHRAEAQAALLAATGRSDAARAIVAAARSSAEAVDKLIADRDAEAASRASLREQHDLDNIARRGDRMPR